MDACAKPSGKISRIATAPPLLLQSILHMYYAQTCPAKAGRQLLLQPLFRTPTTTVLMCTYNKVTCIHSLHCHTHSQFFVIGIKAWHWSWEEKKSNMSFCKNSQGSERQKLNGPDRELRGKKNTAAINYEPWHPRAEIFFIFSETSVKLAAIFYKVCLRQIYDNPRECRSLHWEL